MRSLLVEEEQISMLGKMLYYSAAHLTKRERELYDQLIEQLMRKVNQHRAAEQKKETQSLPSQSIQEAQHHEKQESLRTLTPEQICRAFVDCWNTQDFETEYFCLASIFPHNKRKANNIQDYVMQRMQKYEERHTIGPISKRVSDITSAERHGKNAEIYCFEVHKMPDKDLTLHRQYEMIFEDECWRISDFCTVKSHATPRKNDKKSLAN